MDQMTVSPADVPARNAARPEPPLMDDGPVDEVIDDRAMPVS